MQPDQGNETISLVRDVLTGRNLYADNVTDNTKDRLKQILMPLVTLCEQGTRRLAEVMASLACSSSDSRERSTIMTTQESAPSFARDIQPLFRPADRVAMRWAFDLGNYQDVRAHAQAILGRLASGTRDDSQPTRWFPDGSESIFSPTSLSSKRPGPVGAKKAHIAHGCISSERKKSRR